MICPLCAKELDSDQLAMVCLAHGSIDGAVFVSGQLESDLLRAQACEKPGAHQYWLRHVGCTITHPYWSRLSDFHQPIACIPASAGTVNHPDFDIYLRAYTMLQPHSVKVPALVTEVVFGNNLPLLFAVRMVEGAHRAGGTIHSVQGELVALLYNAGNSAADRQVMGWYADLEDQDHEALLDTIKSHLHAEAWFPAWMIEGDRPLEISMHGKTSVGKTVLALQAMHAGGYGALARVGLGSAYLFAPPLGQTGAGASSPNYLPGEDENVKQHTGLQILTGGQACSAMPPTRFRQGNIKALQITLRAEGAGLDRTVASYSKPGGVRRASSWMVQKIPIVPRVFSFFWPLLQTLIKGRTTHGLKERKVLIYDAPGEAVLTHNRFLLTELMEKVHIAALVVDAHDLFVAPSGLTNTLDAVNDQLHWIIDHNKHKDTNPVRVALLVNKLDTLRNSLATRNELILEPCSAPVPGARGHCDPCHRNDAQQVCSSVVVNLDIPHFDTWYRDAKAKGLLTSGLPKPLEAGSDLEDDCLAMERNAEAWTQSHTYATRVFNLWTADPAVSAVAEINVLLTRLDDLSRVLGEPAGEFPVFFTWTDFQQQNGRLMAPSSHGLAEFLAWAMAIHPASLGVLR